MEPMTIREIMDAVGGKLLGEFGDINRTVGRVETDSRTIHAGSLFVPLVGERFDGHAYINAALEGGAAGCFTQRERESYLPGKFYIKVDSTQRALRDLAKYYKKKFPIPVVALTGSVGKTTTKDMVAAVLGRVWREQTGRTLELSAVHVGLEPSVFRAKAPGLVMASAGPDILDAHSVDERAPLDGLPDYALLLAGAMEAL